MCASCHGEPRVKMKSNEVDGEPCAALEPRGAPAGSGDIDWGGHGAVEPARTGEALLRNVHAGLPWPLTDPGRCSVVTGDYQYFHYGCDGQDDRGWGCGYRTLQTMASWLRHNSPGTRRGPPPSLGEIQRALVDVGDKPASFSGSREWIGTVEASLALGHFYGVPCRLAHIRGGGDQLERAGAAALHRHMEEHGSPVMMGGERDHSSKGIFGVCTGDEGSYLLVVDPHCCGRELGRPELQRRGWVAWRAVSTLDPTSFYNLCMPQTGRRAT